MLPEQTESADNSTPKVVLGVLTRRETAVALRLIRGATNKDIARELDISPRTVEVHRARVFEKLGVKNAVELLRLMNGAEHEASLDDDFLAKVPVAERGAAAVSWSQILSGIWYQPDVDPEAVTIFMSWDAAGAPTGQFILPHSIRLSLHALGLLSTERPLPLEGAIAYGLLIALRNSVPVRLAGNTAVWDTKWGALPRADSRH